MLSLLLAAARRFVTALERSRERGATRAMLRLDDHMLRDLGLTRGDIVACLSAPLDEDPADFLHARQRRNAQMAGAGRARQAEARLAA